METSAHVHNQDGTPVASSACMHSLPSPGDELSWILIRRGIPTASFIAFNSSAQHLSAPQKGAVSEARSEQILTNRSQRIQPTPPCPFYLFIQTLPLSWFWSSVVVYAGFRINDTGLISKQIWDQDESLWSSIGFLWSHWSCWYLDSPQVCYSVGNVLFRFHFHSWGTAWLELLCSCLFSTPSSLSLSRFFWLRDHSAILMLPQRSQSSAALSLSLPSCPPSVSDASAFCAFCCCSWQQNSKGEDSGGSKPKQNQNRGGVWSDRANRGERRGRKLGVTNIPAERRWGWWGSQIYAPGWGRSVGGAVQTNAVSWALYHSEPQLIFTRLTQMKCSSVMIINKPNPLTLVSACSPCAVVYTQDGFLFSVSIVSGLICIILAVIKFMLGKVLTSRALITDGMCT